MMQSPGRPTTLATSFRERLGRWPRPRWNRATKLLLKTVVGLIVLGAVGKHVHQTWLRLHEHGDVVRVAPGWMALGVVLYLAGLACFGVFFDRILKASATPVPLGPALRAYLI